MNKPKLNISDFYHTFHNHHLHNDPGEHVKPEWHKVKGRGKHKALDLRTLRNRTKTKVVVAKNISTMRKELSKHKAK
jgi:hypothetical protein